jgi:hypothetical protein
MTSACAKKRARRLSRSGILLLSDFKRGAHRLPRVRPPELTEQFPPGAFRRYFCTRRSRVVGGNRAVDSGAKAAEIKVRQQHLAASFPSIRSNRMPLLLQEERARRLVHRARLGHAIHVVISLADL